MDAANEIPQGVSPEKRPRFDGETPLHPLSVTKVFDDDDLLREIIVRVGFPTTLVRAALVCKRWLEHASDRKFLSRFRKLHPPRLLGYYLTGQFPSAQGPDVARFVPILPQPPELAAVMRRAKSYNFGAHQIMHCRNGTVFTRPYHRTRSTHGVHHPLCAGTEMQNVPPLPCVQDHNTQTYSVILSKEEAGVLSYFYMLGESTEVAGESTMHIYMLEDGAWRTYTSATCLHRLSISPDAQFVGNKIYMWPAASKDDIIVLDLADSSFSTIQLPEGVKYHYSKSWLSRADDVSSIYLIHLNKLLLRIWLRNDDNWLLVDTICLREMIPTLEKVDTICLREHEMPSFWGMVPTIFWPQMLPTLGMSDHMLEDEGIADVSICQVGDYGQFVLLQEGRRRFYLDIKCRTLLDVHEDTVRDQFYGPIHLLMMIWPPTFPTLKSVPARNAM